MSVLWSLLPICIFLAMNISLSSLLFSFWATWRVEFPFDYSPWLRSMFSFFTSWSASLTLVSFSHNLVQFECSENLAKYPVAKLLQCDRYSICVKLWPIFASIFKWAGCLFAAPKGVQVSNRSTKKLLLQFWDKREWWMKRWINWRTNKTIWPKC